MLRPFARRNSHWSAAGHVTRTHSPSGDHAMSSNAADAREEPAGGIRIRPDSGHRPDLARARGCLRVRDSGPVGCERGGKNRRRAGADLEWHGPVRVVDPQAAPRRGQEPPSVRRPVQGSDASGRRPPENPARLDVDRAQLARGCIREDETAARPPGERPAESPAPRADRRCRRLRRLGAPEPSTYAIRVFASVPVHLGERTPGRASVQRTSPSGSSATSSFSPAATTNRPNGDQLASR